MAVYIELEDYFSSWFCQFHIALIEGKIGQQSVPLIHCSVPNFTVIDAEVLVYDF